MEHRSRARRAHGRPIGAGRAGCSRHAGRRASLRALLAVGALSISGRPAAVAEEPPAWGEIFRAPDAEAAFAVVEGVVAQKRTDAAFSLVQSALGARHAALVTAAGDALREIGATLTVEIAGCVETAARAHDVRLRVNLLRLLGAWGLPEFDAHIAASCAATSAVAEEAVLAAGAAPDASGAPFPLALAAIARALDDKRPEIRRAACMAAGRRRATGVAARLVSLATSDPDEWTSVLAVRALERTGVPTGIEPFVHVLRSPRPSSARAALKAVVVLASAADAVTLRGMLTSPDARIRHAAILALARLAAPHLYAEGPSPPSLASLPPKARQQVVAALLDLVSGSGPRNVRQSAVRALCLAREWAAPLVRPALDAWVDSKDEDLQAVALRLAGAMRATDLRARLVRLVLESKSPLVHSAAARALDDLGPTEATNALLDALRPTVALGSRCRAARALGFLRDERAVRSLSAELGDPQRPPALRAAVLEGLERATGHRFGPGPEPWNAWMASTSALLRQPLPRIDRRATRRAMRVGGRFGFHPESDAALERALLWLGSTQHGGGYWTSREDGWGGTEGQASTYTGLCLSAFADAGYAPREGRFRETVWRAAEFLAGTQDFDGCTSGYRLDRTFAWYVVKLRGIAAYVVSAGAAGLLDAYLGGRHPEWRGPVQRAIDAYADTQVPGSGWGRDALEDATVGTTVLATCVLAPAAAEGFSVPSWVLDGPDEFLRACSHRNGNDWERTRDVVPDPDVTVGAERVSEVYYLDWPVPDSVQRKGMDTPQSTVTEFGALGRAMLGWPRSHPVELASGAYVRDGVPEGMEPPPSNRVHWVHARAWAGALSAFQMGGRTWRRWSDAVARVYPAAQVTEPPELLGSFESDTANADMGRLFATAMSARTLGACYGFPFRPPR